MLSWLSSEQCNVSGEVFVAAADRIRRAYHVETQSLAIEDGDIASSVDELFSKVGVPHPNSNTAFASLVEEVERG